MDASIGLSHVTAAAIVVFLMNKLKDATWFPLLKKDAMILNRAFSVLVAFGVSLGIHSQWTAGTNGSHQLVLDLPSWTALGLGTWHAASQYVLQEILHQVTKPKT